VRFANRANMKAVTLLVGNIPFENKNQPLCLQRFGFMNIKMTVLVNTLKNRPPQSLRCHSAPPAYQQCWTMMITHFPFIDVTKTNGSVWGSGKHKKEIFYHYMMVVYSKCQHTFQYNQLEKVHVPLYDPFKKTNHITKH